MNDNLNSQDGDLAVYFVYKEMCRQEKASEGGVGLEANILLTILVVLQKCNQ